MHKFLSGVAFSAAIFSANMAPVSASPTNIKTVNSVTVSSVAPKSSLVEIEGRTLTNSEADKVEGQVSRITIPNTIQVGICVIGVVSPCNGSNWQPKPRPVSPMPIVRPTPIIRPTPMPVIRPFPFR